jgi:hypothetical protein
MVGDPQHVAAGSQSPIPAEKSVRTGEPVGQHRVVAAPFVFFEDSMHTFIVLDHTGDSRHHFDPNDYVEVLDAKRRFRELSEAGYTAAKRTGNGTSGVIRQFDPTVKETLFIPRLVGG